MRQKLKRSTTACTSTNINSYTLSRRFISRWSFSLWKNVTKDQISLLNRRVTQYRNNTLKRLCLRGWCSYCHERGRRIRHVRKFFRSWRKVFDRKKCDLKLLSIGKDVVERSRRARCLRQWQSATRQCVMVHAHQVHRIEKYIRTSPVLWFPHRWIRQSPYLMLMSVWKMVGQGTNV